MPDIYTLVNSACFPGRARGGVWSELGLGGVATRDVKPGSGKTGWSWKHDPAELNAVTDLVYQDGTVGVFGGFNEGHRYRAFDRVEWKTVGVAASWKDQVDDAPAWELAEKYPGDQELVSLPLTEAYAVGRFSLNAGEVETSDLWPLAARIDTALVLIFAYELRFASAAGRRTSACTLHPVAAVDYKHRSFMEVPGVEGLGATADASFRKVVRVRDAAGSSGSEKTTEVQLANPRVVVALTLTTCEPRADYEPGEFVTMTRLHPHALVLSSIPMHTVVVSTRVKRPTKSSVYHPPASDTDESHTEKIKSILVADTNERRGAAYATLGVMPSFPLWYNMFDYYRVLGDADATNAAKGKVFTVVRRTKGARTLDGCARWAPSYAFGDEANARGLSVRKVARQGAYDNIHMSPRMVAPEALMAKYPPLRDKLREVAQAPFCDCDCVHTHWRWGEEATGKHSMGWGANGPHTVAGAPMVPPNQTIKLLMEGDAEFIYYAYAKNTSALRWQVFFHHGSALALRVGESTLGWVKKQMAAGAVNTADATDCDLLQSWYSLDAGLKYSSVYYYRLRYHTTFFTHEPTERLQVLDRESLEDG